MRTPILVLAGCVLTHAAFADEVFLKSGGRRALITIQPMFNDTAAPTSRTQRATKKAMAFWRRVTYRL